MVPKKKKKGKKEIKEQSECIPPLYAQPVKDRFRTREGVVGRACF